MTPQSSETTRLFAYGTFAHPRWRAAILGATYAAEAATVTGWRRTVTASGYFSIARDDDARIDGVAIALDAIGWSIADAWEEVPRYERVSVAIVNARGAGAAYAYVSTETLGRDAGADDRRAEDEARRFARLDDAQVEAAIARFIPEMRALRTRAATRP